MEGERQNQHTMSWLTNVTESTDTWYIAAALAYFIFIVANIFFFLQLLTMWAGFGKISLEPTLYEIHHEGDPHGSDSTIEDLEKD